jgi:hypothetical protein
MRWAPTITLLLAACYRPAPSPGAPCPDGACPSGQRCVAGTCQADDDGPAPDDAPPGVDPASDGPGTPPGSWRAPTQVPGVGSSSTETDPSMTADRLTIVFASNRPGGLGSDDLYIGTRASTAAPFTVAALTALNTPQRERSPEISPDGTTLYFSSNRSGGYDVYVSSQAGGGGWSAPQLVTALSSTADEGDIAFSPDGLTAIIERANKLYLATRPSLSVAFGPSVLVPELDVAGQVAGPSLTSGTAVVYFHDRQPRDLFVAYRQGAAFTAPAPIPELATSGRDAAPFVTPDGAHLVFERDGELYETSR